MAILPVSLCRCTVCNLLLCFPFGKCLFATFAFVVLLNYRKQTPCQRFKDVFRNFGCIFRPMTMDNSVLCPWHHFLSMDCRKSRNSSFSIFSRLFSYLYSANVFAGLRPRCLGIPSAFRLRSLFNSSFYYILVLKSVVFRDLPLRFPCFYHCFNLWIQQPYMGIFSF